MAVKNLKCKECSTEYELGANFFCSECFGPLEVKYDFSDLNPEETRRRIQAGSRGIWRYSDFLPFQGKAGDPLEPGMTPLIKADRLSERLGTGAEIFIKNDAANPTHSFKDRVVAVAIAKAKELGFETVACASTGNLANAVAAHAAAAGLDSYVFVPSNLEEQKLLATDIYGTNLVGVKGNYDDVNRLCTQLADEKPWAFVNVNLRPYYAEGSKTLAYETVEQLGWNLPDRVVAPIASGSLFTKISRGFQEWKEVGLVEGKQPVFHGAQAEGCSPVATAFAEGTRVCRPQKPDTIAKSLAIGDPADGPYAVAQANETGGSIDAVSDDEIREGIRLLAESTGIFTETAGGVTVGVLKKLAERGELKDGEKVVVYITGEGLKTLDANRDSFALTEIDPNPDSFESHFGQEVVA
ncbi:MAG TPA: threonine synthase [Solirubrobacterales bacterium]|nr:threonine synthase [Solirubrobacterales bacterium]HMU26209.1 threonine synthase [Solirubrobacterales bacterium]HMX72172.1 threonine synthase [Solirubrobacterales bacterium]HMY25762.1 threonine synthase [Solirubrobacterales bacterium]HNA23075.1 threonine synthase [Solirubrobacterales bacterium]